MVDSRQSRPQTPDRMGGLWKPGETVTLRGIVSGRVWSARSVIVVEDSPDETILALLPGSECAFPDGYWRWKQGDTSQGTRWHQANTLAWTLRAFAWERNRFLIFLKPERYYNTYLIWDGARDEFACYYIDFQLPARRTAIGFDSLDLDLDVVIEPDYEWRWKDEAAYEEGVAEGGIKPEWAREIERARPQVVRDIQARACPLDGSWNDWRPPANWSPVRLRAGWERA